MKIVFSWRDAIAESGLKPITRLVLFNLSRFLNDQGSCYRSIEHQCTDTGLSKKTVIEHLNYAVESGFIQKISRRKEGATWVYHIYNACWPDEFSPTRDAISCKDATGVDNTPSKITGCISGNNEVTDIHPNSYTNSFLDVNKKKNIKKKESTKRILCSLAEWEAVNGTLDITHIQEWVAKNSYHAGKMAKLLGDFRLKMQAKDARYANFKLAFYDHFTSGWLSLKPEQCKVTAQALINFDDRGQSL